MEETDPTAWNTYQEDNTTQKWEVFTGSAYIRASHFTLGLVDFHQNFSGANGLKMNGTPEDTNSYQCILMDFLKISLTSDYCIPGNYSDGKI